MMSRRKDDTAAEISDRVARHVKANVYWFYKECTDIASMSQSWAIYTLTWLIQNLQLMYFISDAYVPFHWNGSVSRVIIDITGFVTEFPTTSTTSYLVSSVWIYAVLLHTVYAAWSRHHYRWSLPILVHKHLLQWSTSIFYLPLIIPHIKLIFGCILSARDDIAQHPYNSMVCGSSTHTGLTIFSIFTLAFWIIYAVITKLLLFHCDLPDLAPNTYVPLSMQHTNRPQAVFLLIKTALLVLLITGQRTSWRFACAVLMFLAGLAMVRYQLQLLPHWRDAAQTMALTKALLCAWTGLTGFIIATSEGKFLL